MVEDNTDRQVTNVNPFLYRGYYYDWETGLYYLQSRYYDPTIGRFINGDEAEYLGRSETTFGYNLFAYCENLPVNRQDSSGHLFGILLAAVVGTVVVYGCIKKGKEVEKAIKYSVPLFKQGKLSLCWAYCQAMIESYRKADRMKQPAADKRAKEIAIKVNGKTHWNSGGMPTNAGKKRTIKNIEALYNVLHDYGPVYGFYKGPKSSHLIVVTGVDVKRNRVYTNNPWGVQGEQTYNGFLNGVAKKPTYDGKGLVFKYIYHVK